jgi:hypothetical protein
MSIARAVVAALLSIALPLAGGESQPLVPPSPSTAPGVRIWPDPAFTHWPAVTYPDEARNVAFSLPVRKPGTAGTIGWSAGQPMPFTLPANADSISGLLPLPSGPGTHEAVVKLDGKDSRIPLVIADAREPWPLAELRNGFPVDAKGVAVVLSDRRRGTKDERVWSLLDGSDARPAGRPLLVGDPLEAMGGDAWRDLDADARPALDERYPQHAVLVALAAVLTERPATGAKGLPRTIIWCPGNQVLFGGAWSPEEERLLGVIRTRCERLGAMPRLVLALPPWPLDQRLREQAKERREVLVRSATRLSWAVVDLARAAGEPEEANKVAPDVFTRYPLGEAQARMKRALKESLER